MAISTKPQIVPVWLTVETVTLYPRNGASQSFSVFTAVNKSRHHRLAVYGMSAGDTAGAALRACGGHERYISFACDLTSQRQFDAQCKNAGCVHLDDLAVGNELSQLVK